jgi:uncharacterized phiE125 gp8 family phage protein
MFPGIWRRRGTQYGVPGTNHLELVQVTQPAIEPVSLTMVKQQTRIQYPDADDLLYFYIGAARDKIERYLRRALITQTWDLKLDWGPAWIELPKPPIQSVVGVYTTGLDNVEVTVPTTTYFVDAATGLVGLNIGQVWPIHRGIAGFRIQYVCGYGNLASDVPASIRKEILSLVAQFDDIREQVDLPQATQAMLHPYRVEGGIRMAKGSSREDILA